MDIPAWTPGTPSPDAPTLRRLLPSIDFAVVHFWAIWNGVDRKMDEVLCTVRPQFVDRIQFFALETDPESAHQFCQECMIASLPTLVCFRCGEQAEKLIGLRTRDELAETFERWCS